MKRIVSNYDKHPVITVPAEKDTAHQGWDATCNVISNAVKNISSSKKIIVLECYQGVLDQEIIPQLTQQLPGTYYYSKDFMLEEAAIQSLIFPDVTNDEVFGYITRLQLHDLFDAAKVKAFKKHLQDTASGTIYLYGPGAALLTDTIDLLVYFDMPRWEIQLRFRKNEIANLGCSNYTLKASLQYKQAFFVDWRICDKHKKKLMQQWHFVVDTTLRGEPKIVQAAALHRAYQQTARQPFRLVPFFDPGPWGGQWIKEYCDLDRSEKNYAWAFDCVPEENSLLYRFNDVVIETPAMNLVYTTSRQLLGEAVQARFGDEFPIRFDFLDTIEGGNLSLQVHPTTDYIREQFGMDYTQDESYYMLDAGDDAVVYLGFKDDVDSNAMLQQLRDANANGTDFDADAFVGKWPVKKHDHVLIPAGTIHCSGKNAMVLEISATPYIFTFKLWDWGRMGLDGKPRPINIEHGSKVLDWSRQTAFTKRELINTVTTVASGDGWTEERTGLHEREFIETRRHWFSKTVVHETGHSVNVLNLVEGKEAIVESPTGAFEPFVVHYAETFVIPEQVKVYTIRPYGESEGKQCATIKAYVRTKG
ncbi:MAG: class I mannose-6-phosphate isomerase [Chitinophagaceae bacterium]